MLVNTEIHGEVILHRVGIRYPCTKNNIHKRETETIIWWEYIIICATADNFHTLFRLLYSWSCYMSKWWVCLIIHCSNKSTAVHAPHFCVVHTASSMSTVHVYIVFQQ